MTLQPFVLTDSSPTVIYTLSLHDALPISAEGRHVPPSRRLFAGARDGRANGRHQRLGVPVDVADVPLQRVVRSEEHTSELQSQFHLVCRLLLEKKKIQDIRNVEPS